MAGQQTQIMPLFPLQRVLFPTVSLPLQIFEQRYLGLVKQSLSGDRPFAVVPILAGREVGATPEIHHWGTAVRICDWSQLPNGLWLRAGSACASSAAGRRTMAWRARMWCYNPPTGSARWINAMRILPTC